jgi:hypothetical protein
MAPMKKTIGLALAVLVAGCTGQIEGPAEVKLAAATHQPAEDGAFDVVVEPDALRVYFEGEPPAYQVGEIVYGTEGPGYLRRIESIERDAHKLVLHTTQASFEEAFEDVHVAERVLVSPAAAARIAPTWRSEDVVIRGQHYVAEIRHDAPVAGEVPQALTTSFVWEFPRLSITLKDASGNLALQVSAEKLRIEKQITLDVKVDFGFFRLKELRFVDEEDTRTTLEGVSVQATGALTLADVSLPVFDAPALAIVPVGPLVFTVGARIDLGASLGMSGVAELHTTSQVGFHSYRKSGVVWNGDYQFIDESTNDADADFGPVAASGSVSASAAVSVTGALNVKLYGVAGPEIFARVTPLAADLTIGTEGVDGTLSASASAGARFAFPFFSLAGTSVTFASWSHEYGTFHQDF